MKKRSDNGETELFQIAIVHVTLCITFFFEKLLIKQMITIPVPTISQHPVSTVQKYATGACIVLLSY